MAKNIMVKMDQDTQGSRVEVQARCGNMIGMVVMEMDTEDWAWTIQCDNKTIQDGRAGSIEEALGQMLTADTWHEQPIIA